AGGDRAVVDRVENAQGGGVVRVGGVVVAEGRISSARLGRGIGGGVGARRIHVGVAVVVAAGGQAGDGEGKQGRGGDALDVVHWNSVTWGNGSAGHRPGESWPAPATTAGEREKRRGGTMR